MLQLFKKDSYPIEGNIKRKTLYRHRDSSIQHPAFKILIGLIICGVVYATFLYVNEEDPVSNYRSSLSEDSSFYNDTVSNNYTIAKRQKSVQVNSPGQPVEQPSQLADPTVDQPDQPLEEVTQAYEEKTNPVNKVNRAIVKKEIEIKAVAPPVENVARKESPTVTTEATAKFPAEVEPDESEISYEATNDIALSKEKYSRSVRYTVSGPDVYFHNKPDPETRRNAFINRWNNAVLKPLGDKNGFIYIVYKNPWGQTSKGWLKKEDLKPLNK